MACVLRSNDNLAGELVSDLAREQSRLELQPGPGAGDPVASTFVRHWRSQAESRSIETRVPFDIRASSSIVRQAWPRRDCRRRDPRHVAVATKAPCAPSVIVPPLPTLVVIDTRTGTVNLYIPLPWSSI